MTWTIKSLLRWATCTLQQQGIETARLDSEVLLAHTLNTDRLYLYLHYDKPLLPSEYHPFYSLLRRRAAHEPLAYIMGKKEFWSLEFVVTPGVLIPRPETEILVEQAIRLLRERLPVKTPLWVLDIGTGSGNIAISIANEVKECLVIALDCSASALSCAKQNALRHGVASRIDFVQGDLFEPLRSSDRPFDLIVSNPPYVSTTAWETLSPDIKDYEPLTAIAGGRDGLEYLRSILLQAHRYLSPGGSLLLEFGEGHGITLLEICRQQGFYPVSLVKDYSGIERVLIAHNALLSRRESDEE